MILTAAGRGWKDNMGKPSRSLSSSSSSASLESRPERSFVDAGSSRGGGGGGGAGRLDKKNTILSSYCLNSTQTFAVLQNHYE